ncbi:hypothetical protein KQX54_019667 [Cotesia glomerata]|uniref:Uncharacterized protein n=1 Tax=Cotesia glomerata TaxID=32391 RepID=A0AAV7IFG4_COTGL|nr:hypothetical protein KQX54_019667 [Cotesia glomerata]
MQIPITITKSTQMITPVQIIMEINKSYYQRVNGISNHHVILTLRIDESRFALLYGLESASGSVNRLFTMSAKYLLVFETQMGALNSMFNEFVNGLYNRIQLVDCEVKFEVLEATWNKIVDANDKLPSCKYIDITHNYFKEGRYTKAVNCYALVKTALKRRITEIEPRQVPVSPKNGTVNEASESRPPLPTIQLPKFKG